MKTLAGSLFLVGWLSLAQAAEPQWLVEARGREGKPGESHVVTSEDKKISFAVPAPLVGTVTDEGTFYEAVLQLGPDTAAACDVFKDEIDAAATLRSTAANTFDKVIDGHQGKLEQKAIQRLDTQMIADTPVLVLVWDYRVNDGKAAQLGGLRQFAGNRQGHGVYCGLNDLGYGKTFEQMLQALLGSLSPVEGYKAPYYSEASIASLKSLQIGYSRVELRLDAEGDTQSTEVTSMFVPVGADALQSFDVYHVEWAHPDGQLINSKYVSSASGEIEENIDLGPTDRGGWVAKGTYKGKEVSAQISDGPPVGWLGHLLLMKQLLAAEHPVGKDVSYLQWMSDDPERFTPMKATVLAAAGGKRYSVRESASVLTGDFVVDAPTGAVLSGTIDIGPLQLKADRVSAHGAP